VALIARCLRATTDPGDLVLDPFAGSATTGVAALELGRHFVGYEQDENHALLAARRLSAITPEELVVPKSQAAWSVGRARQPTLFGKA